MAEQDSFRLPLIPAATPWSPAARPTNALAGLPLDAAALEDHFGVLLPDYVHADYPYDVPPGRREFASGMLSWIGAWRTCPHAPCRRTRFCIGTDGPPCYRADRHALQQALLMCHLEDLGLCARPDYEALLKAAGNRHAVVPPASHPDPQPRRKHRRRR